VSYRSSHDVLFATSPLQHWYLGAQFGNGVNVVVDAEVGLSPFLFSFLVMCLGVHAWARIV
jgi:hypothetical protein